METCLFAEPLLSHGYCIIACFTVVAQQQVYMPQYMYYGIFSQGKNCEASRDNRCLETALQTCVLLGNSFVTRRQLEASSSARELQLKGGS
jgi:hypothetical protein